MAHPDWKSAARADIDSVSSSWDQQFGWNPQTVEGDEHIDVFVTLRQGEKRYLLRLRYQQDFQRVGRREAFCDPRIPDKSGQHYWPSGNAFKTKKEAICIPGTFGFHHKLHARDANHPANQTTLGELLHRIQRQLENGR